MDINYIFTTYLFEGTTKYGYDMQTLFVFFGSIFKVSNNINVKIFPNDAEKNCCRYRCISEPIHILFFLSFVW